MTTTEPFIQIILIASLMLFTGVIVSCEGTFWEICASIMLAGSAYCLAFVHLDNTVSRY